MMVELKCENCGSTFGRIEPGQDAVLKSVEESFVRNVIPRNQH